MGREGTGPGRTLVDCVGALKGSLVAAVCIGIGLSLLVALVLARLCLYVGGVGG